VADNLYFGGRLIRPGREVVAVDRLGSVRWRRNLDTGATAQFDYWPYGQEKPSATAQEGEKFGTYYRDATGLDYADQRYYSSTSGRFLTADRFVTATALRSPTRGWNRYAYVEGDPVNLFDPSGLLYAFPDDNLEQGAGICSSPLGSITTYGPEGPSSNIVFNPVAGFRGDSGGVGGGQAGAPQSLTPTEAMKKALENLQGPWQRCLDRFLTDARFDWTKFQNQARDIKWLDSRGKRGALSITHLGKRTTRAALAGDSYAVVVAEAAEGTPIRLCWDTYGTLSSATHRRSPIPSTRPCTSSSHSPNRRMTRG
jgi:RHS repeat-associated protein